MPLATFVIFWTMTLLDSGSSHMNLTTRSLLLPLLLFCALTHAEETNEQLARQVRETETAFAATMAKRDLAAFSAFLADEAVFFGATPLRGKAAVIAGWKA